MSATTGTQLEQLPASDQVGRAFKAAIAAMRRLRARESHHHEPVSDAQYGLLFGLCGEDCLASSELAARADLSPASATEMLDLLAQTGLVRRERSERDRRIVLVSLTERGQAMLEERRQRYEPRWRGALGEFSDEELLSAVAVLDRLRRLFDELGRD